MTGRTAKIGFIVLAALIMAGCAPRESLKMQRIEAYQSYQAGDYGEAAERFEKLAKKLPRDADIWFRLGNSYARAMKPKKAIESYENALLREPGMAKAWYNMGLIYIRAAAKTFIDMGSFVPDDNPIGQQGKILGQGLTKLLEGPAPKAKDEK